MRKITTDPTLVSFSTTTYRFLLAFYPTHFRQEYGPHMVQVFRDCCLRAYRRTGPPGLLSLWLLTLFDILKTVIEEQLARDTHMTRTRFIQLCGWGMALGGLTQPLGFLSANSLGNLLRTFGFASTAVEFLPAVLIIGSIFLIVLGMLGLFLRFSTRMGTAGKTMLIGGMVFGLMGMIAGWMLVVTDSQIAWSIWFLGLFLMFGSLAVFGAAALQGHLLPRWNALPLLAGISFPTAVILAVILEQINHTWQDDLGNIIGMTQLLVTATSLVLLGYLLQRDTEQLPEITVE